MVARDGGGDGEDVSVAVYRYADIVVGFLWGNYLLERLRGAEPSGVWANRVMNEAGVVSRKTSRLYLYSKEDEIIWYGDLEENVAGVKTLGYRAVDTELFEGSPHVGHMRMHFKQYWNRISDCWKAALAMNRD